ncbi:MAG: hypothetical protein GXW85_04855 [Clostridia bacterium]|nr:hypothetical protein [Clostridia bacterium]
MSEKQKKPIYKRWWFIAIVIVFLIGLIGGGGEDEAGQDNTITEGKTEEPVEEKKTDNIPREYRNALRAAQNYVDIMPFSKKGLFNQLTSEYGDHYPEDAARYAIENVKVDWREEALEAAINYLKIMPMSDKELFDQLTSEYGEQFTEEEARYAIENLPD